MAKTLTKEAAQALFQAIKSGKNEQEIMDEFFSSQGKRGRASYVPHEKLQEYVNRAVQELQEKGKKIKASPVAKRAWFYLFKDSGENLDAKIPDYPQIANLIAKGVLNMPKPEGTPVEQTPEEDELEQKAIEAGASIVVTEESPSGQVEPPTVVSEPVQVTTISEGVVNTKTVNPPQTEKPKSKSKNRNRSREKAHA